MDIHGANIKEKTKNRKLDEARLFRDRLITQSVVISRLSFAVVVLIRDAFVGVCCVGLSLPLYTGRG